MGKKAEQLFNISCHLSVVFERFCVFYKHFTGKESLRNIFFNENADPYAAALFKRRLQHRHFPVTFVKL